MARRGRYRVRGLRDTITCHDGLAGQPDPDCPDHDTHEAICVIDPDGNTLELMGDRPPEQWPRDEQGHIAVAFGPDLLDLGLDDLLGELD
jgi:catechol 2,3-dioxygenase